MAAKPFVFTIHAQEAIAERELDPMWIEEVVRRPDWIEDDPERPAVERRFKVIAQHGGRILRAVVVETEVEIRIVTIFFDRKAQRR